MILDIPTISEFHDQYTKIFNNFQDSFDVLENTKSEFLNNKMNSYNKFKTEIKEF